ncbi:MULTISPECIES: methionine ABC transporter ATP-binding protein [unclassified Enterococcus]|uniref:methionine ABC transporter ATP-binding protein n=1 Tax=unclassified Enterococcus TaxID=2608891 RepID=UPI001552D61C|nr:MULTISPECIES: methionine ABC transporter ATP-binding protein [unclassified Enterococcus]MBS7577078.1 methionine ABC transporter ATP-binding protein [Enterococcus sp. MMGLQ5-2]MBS7584475.1 methionine ABC transporter ATP-binding protein [Enterococcus sp. MMGLQ5-1]NPD12330.1 methionine ABC transporter ATP-binding protein [Enterococcus sp. MMGLQ5-1]NPD36912.1 methionine ABC transporter ATP-binding protein [Enterococcus sp. MMGLQ5-2]
MINLNNIDVKFTSKNKTVTAVDNVSLTIEKGDIYGIVGYSGAGKSTLVRVINLLQVPTKGSVVVDGTDLLALKDHDLRIARKNIGMIFQHFNLMSSRTIFDNVAFPLKGSGLSKQAVKEKVEDLLDLVGILDKKDNYPAQLSGGQKQRVAIARALANDPKILLCDEATSALDPKTTLAVLELLKSINEKLGITIVIITHEMQVVKEICNQVAVMESGKIIEKGQVVDIFQNPKNPLTVDFIRTATHIEQAEKNIVKHTDKPIYELKFVGDRTTEEPIIINLYREFGVVAGILYGNIEFVQNTSIGSLLVTLDHVEDFEAIQRYLNAMDAQIKIVKEGNEK